MFGRATTGFLAGISAHILLSQLPAILGLAAPDGSLPQRAAILAGHLTETNPLTLSLRPRRVRTRMALY
jgi:sulfate permease, SulP family